MSSITDKSIEILSKTQAFFKRDRDEGFLVDDYKGFAFNTPEIMPSISTIYKYFGNWEKFIAAGQRFDFGTAAKQKAQEIETTIETDTMKGTQDISVKSTTIDTLEKAIEHLQIDLNKWKIVKHKITIQPVSSLYRDQDLTWDEGVMTGYAVRKPEFIQTKNYHISITLAQRTEENIMQGLRELIEEFPRLLPPMTFKINKNKSSHALELALYDGHIGKLAWGRETGQGDYDVEISCRIYEQACVDSLSKALDYRLEKIFYIIGQDLLHVENFKGITPEAGNILDVDSRVTRVFKHALKTVIKCLYMCREQAPTEVIWVPGNHDPFASYAMCMAINEHFRRDKGLTVDYSENWFKHISWGKLLIGLTHNADRSQVNVVNLLAQQFPELWGKSSYREIHCGHLHKKEEVKYKPTLTSGGVIIRRVPALSYIDKWHSDNLYVDAVPSGEAFLLNRETGVEAHFTSNVRVKDFNID